MDGTALDRRSFLASLALFPAAVVAGLGTRQAKARPEVELDSFHVAGYRYHAGPAVEAALRPGVELRAVRERANPHDPNAVSIWMRDAMIGYVPRERNAVVARMMDAGMEIGFRVAEVRRDAAAWERVRVTALMGR
ncbi:MAG: HIRAN domain-containing protein [Deltaproteobacteria bacterium]|nr:HIRAN domain-containing protein [Deltaproteobacteria bacterium]